MKRFKNILYFADGEQQLGQAFERAMSLARSNHAHLTLFDVIDEAEDSLEIEKRLGVTINAALREMRYETLSQMLAATAGEGDAPAIRVATGVPFIETIRAVLSDGYDLVIKASRSSAGLSERLLGSTDMHLLRKCPCPVWIDRPSEPGTYQRIVAAVDPQRDEGWDCGLKVLQMASSMAQREQAELTIVHAWHLYEESALESGFSQVSGDKLAGILAEAERNRRVKLDKLISDCGLTEAGHEVLMPKGSPAQTIRKVVEQQQADLIVMGTVGRTGIPGFIIGNTAENVLQASEASILAVKPAGFESPVTLP